MEVLLKWIVLQVGISLSGCNQAVFLVLQHSTVILSVILLSPQKMDLLQLVVVVQSLKYVQEVPIVHQ